MKGVSFEVVEGLCFGLLGPNGAGKTTTIEMMEGIIPPSSGSILYKGAELSGNYSRELGIQFQSTALQSFLTVKDTLNLFRSFYSESISVQELVELCSLGDILNRDNSKLSGGQKQRLLLAIALVNDPQVLFLDEPTTGLDPQARHNFWQLIRNIKAKGKTVILTTHYMDEAEQLCDQIAIMDKGEIIAIDTPQDLLQQNFSGVMLRLPEKVLNGVGKDFPHDYTQREGYIEFLTQNVEGTLGKLLEDRISLAELKIQPPNLEDLFLKLTGHQLRT